MTDKPTHTSFESLRQMWTVAGEGEQCSNPECPNAHRIQIRAESITITNLIVTGELTPDIRAAMSTAPRR